MKEMLESVGRLQVEAMAWKLKVSFIQTLYEQ